MGIESSNQKASGIKKVSPGGMPEERFVDRFETRAQAEWYRDRYRHGGRRAQMERREHDALRKLLEELGPLEVALDLPSGTGRFAEMLAKFADHVILADASAAMLEVAQEDLSHLNALYLQTDAQQINLANKSVDLVFCHRFFHHFDSVSARSRILSELVRVSRRYVILSYYSRGPRKHLLYLLRRALPLAGTSDALLTLRRFRRETSAAGLHLVRQLTLRKPPFVAVFCLFERT